MSRRRFLAASAIGAGTLLGAGAAVAALTRPGGSSPDASTGPGAEDVTNIVDARTEAKMFPGGITKQADGSYYVTYELKPDGGTAEVRGRRLPSLHAAAGPPEVFYGGISIDPSVVTMPAGQTVILLHHANTDSLITRSPTATFSSPVVVAREAAESMISRVGDRVFIAFVQADAPDPFQIPVFAQEILSPTTYRTPVDTGARAGAAEPGGSHFQKRCSIGGIGSGDLLLAWNQPATPTGGHRSIWVARSSDGVTWTGHRMVADDGDDLRNPFVLQVGTETRVYYVKPGNPLGMVRTTDAGTTWSAPAEVQIPPTVHDAARPSFFVDDGRVYCFAAWTPKVGSRLGIFPI
jgi:hypothetical protein